GQARRHDDPRPKVALVDSGAEGVGIGELLDFDDPFLRAGGQSLGEPSRDPAAVLIVEADRGDGVLAERSAEDGVEDERQHQRGDYAEDESRPVPEPEAQVFGSYPPRSSHQSRNAFPVRWRKTASRSGSCTSTPVTVIPADP